MASLKNAAQYVELQLDIGTDLTELGSDDQPAMKSALMGGFKASASVTYLKNLKKFLAKIEDPRIQ